MKLAVVKNLCPNMDIRLGGTKFNPALEEESHILDQALAQPCSDLLFDCSLYELPMNCSRLFKTFSTGTKCASNCNLHFVVKQSILVITNTRF